MEAILLGIGSPTLGAVLYFMWRTVSGNSSRLDKHSQRMDATDAKLDRIAEDTAYIRGKLD